MLEFVGERAVGPNTPLVVFETMDDETIIMHHGTGCYFDTAGTGAVIWQALEPGATLSTIVDTLTGLFVIEPKDAEAVITSFLASLAEHGLIKDIHDPAPACFKAPHTRGVFQPPVLGVHSDLTDMLLLDPIHEVDDAGWPAARQHDAVV